MGEFRLGGNVVFLNEMIVLKSGIMEEKMFQEILWPHDFVTAYFCDRIKKCPENFVTEFFMTEFLVTEKFYLCWKTPWEWYYSLLDRRFFFWSWLVLPVFLCCKKNSVPKILWPPVFVTAYFLSNEPFLQVPF